MADLETHKPTAPRRTAHRGAGRIGHGLNESSVDTSAALAAEVPSPANSSAATAASVADTFLVRVMKDIFLLCL